MTVSNRRKKEGPSKFAKEFAIYLSLSDRYGAVPMSALKVMVGSDISLRRYLTELKKLVFGDTMTVTRYCRNNTDDFPTHSIDKYTVFEVELAYDRAETFMSVRPAEGKETPNAAQHRERLSRVIAILKYCIERDGEEAVFFYDDGEYFDYDDDEEEPGPYVYPKATEIYRALKDGFPGATVRTFQRDLKELKAAMQLYFLVEYVY